MLAKKSGFYRGIVAAAIILAVLPLFCFQGIPFGNDASFHLSRVASLSEALQKGVFFPGVYADYFEGMGYGNGLFYPDIFLYFPAFLMLLGISNVLAYKVLLIAVTAGMGVTMYLSVYRVSRSEFAAMASAVAYLLCSFHTTDLYIRSSIGDLLAFVFLPLVLCGLYEVLIGDKRWGMLCVGFSGLILSHLLTALIMAVLAAFICLFNGKSLIKEKSRWRALLKAGTLCFLLTAFFTLPMIEQMLVSPIWGDTGLLGSIENWAVPITKLILPLPQPLGQRYVSPAGIGVIITVVGVYGVCSGKIKPWIKKLVILGLLLLLMASKLFPWALFSGLLGTLQFPWRLYLFTSVFLCFGFGSILEATGLKESIRPIVFAVLVSIMATVFILSSLWIYGVYTPFTENLYPHFAAGCEYLPADMTLTDIQELQETDAFTVLRKDYHRYEIYPKEAVASQTLELPIIYYAGYTAYEDGNKRLVSRSERGFVQIEGYGDKTPITLVFEGTLLRKISFALSLAAYAYLIFKWIIHRVKRGNHGTKNLDNH